MTSLLLKKTFQEYPNELEEKKRNEADFFGFKESMPQAISQMDTLMLHEVRDWLK